MDVSIKTTLAMWHGVMVHVQSLKMEEKARWKEHRRKEWREGRSYKEEGVARRKELQEGRISKEEGATSIVLPKILSVSGFTQFMFYIRTEVEKYG